ncbi:DUF2058 domain-containing protein [Aquimonas voraii]|uniref:Nucleoprotein/polynucleotide-associated enzyme n=1 Tax=Aquimonas voraii TaxID=265719 RepID=A0A1G6YZ80_9GAMM|nr:DUF2058 domain-containing protein [Aquimonas voraii]SDD95621.1 hypothetical protein SAMN04488509_111106 [Aquimonas voraii]
MARNPLQDQLLKAGLVNKNKLDQVVRQQQKARTGKAAPAADADAEAVDAERLRQERAARDRALEAQRRSEREAAERAAQVRQIIEAHRVKAGDDGDYRFEHAGLIRSLRIGQAQRPLLGRGALLIVSLGDAYALVARDVGDRLRAIDPAVICVDHAQTPQEAPAPDSDDEFYSRFQVPDDLVW